MVNRPLVSLIMPVFNSEEYLCKTLENVLEQTFINFELILVNDGSTDKSAQICEQYRKQDNRIKVYHLNNNGPGNARNFGISVARGEYIQFIDSDDLLEPNMMEKLLYCMIVEKADIVVCGFKKIDDSKNENTYTLSSKTTQHKNIKKDFVKLLKLGLAYSPWNKLYKKSIIEKSKIKFNVEIFTGEDALFNIEYFSQCSKVFILGEPLYIYFQRKGSLTNTINKDKEKVQKLLYGRLIEYLGNDVDQIVLKEVNAYYLMEFSYIIYQNCMGIKNIVDFFKKSKDTKRFTKSPEFKAVKKNSYPYSLIQKLVLFLSKSKCESLLLLTLYCHNRLYNRSFI